jgi:pimeloyl-ACP methyl ester carboxylesterase
MATSTDAKARVGSLFRDDAGERLIEQRYTDLLDSWPIPADRCVLETRFGETFVVASGAVDAPPVIALQGSGANTAQWLPQITALAERHRVYAVDVIGEPGRSAPSRPPLSTDAYACWLDDVLAALELSRVAMIGVSLGGWFALDYAIRRPDKVAAVVVQNPSGVGRRRIGVLVKAVAFRPFGQRGLAAIFRAAVGPLPKVPADQEVDTRQMELAFLIFQHFRHRMEPIPVFPGTSLAGLTMPVLAIVGGRDPMVNAAQTKQRLLACAPTATVRLLPDAGHLLPDQAAAIVEFLIESENREPQ